MWLCICNWMNSWLHHLARTNWLNARRLDDGDVIVVLRMVMCAAIDMHATMYPADLHGLIPPDLLCWQ